MERMPNIKIVSHLVGNIGKYATFYFTRYPPHVCHFHWYIQVSHPMLPLSSLSSRLQKCLIVYLLWLDQAFQMPPPHKKKSKGHKSGDPGGHSHDPLFSYPVPDCVSSLIRTNFSDAPPPTKRSPRGTSLVILEAIPMILFFPIQWPGICWPNHSHTGTAWSSSTLRLQVNVALFITIYTLR